MKDTPRKKLSLTRKPKLTTGASAAAAEEGTGSDSKTVKRSGKRRIVNSMAKPHKKAVTNQVKRAGCVTVDRQNGH